MNIFTLSINPFEAAAYHCDKHVVKMVVEYAQLLSTAHRLLDGRRELVELPNGRQQEVALLPGETVNHISVLATTKLNTTKTRHKVGIHNPVCYNVSHANHPCARWTRETDANYHWLAQLLRSVLQQYTARYGRVHGTQRVEDFLSRAPRNIRRDTMTPFVQTMPDEYKQEDAVEAYRDFYAGEKSRFARWTAPSTVPKWYTHKTGERNGTLLTAAA